jgi:hypothetical protein
MSSIQMPDPEAGPRASSPLLDVLIRAGLIAALAVLCYQVFAPFLSLTAWSTILAVTMYPFHRWLARRAGGRQWIASTILIISGKRRGACQAVHGDHPHRRAGCHRRRLPFRRSSSAWRCCWPAYPRRVVRAYDRLAG